MNQEQSEQLKALLRLADVRPLTEAEIDTLRNLLAKDDGTAAVSHQLEIYYPLAYRQRVWSQKELKQIAAGVDREVGRRSGRKRIYAGFQQLAWGMAAVMLLVGLVSLLVVNRSPQIEPAVRSTAAPTHTATPLPTLTPTVTATPLPTPTLQPDFQYADLLSAPITSTTVLDVDTYTLTVQQAQAEWDGALFLPVQMPDRWEFLGANVYQGESAGSLETAPIFEVAFRQKTSSRDQLWVLSQTPADDLEANDPLPVSYQPLAQISETNSYEDTEVNIGQIPARGYQYEDVDQESTPVWIVYNTVTWVQDGQRLTLTYVLPNLYPTTLVASMGERLDIQPLELPYSN